MREAEIHDIEVQVFLEALRLRHGYDFTHYARASIKRRLEGLVKDMGHQNLSEIIPLLLREHDMLPKVLGSMSVPVTEMFRDPQIFKALREKVLPMLSTYPRVNIWQAGCATGEEVYSLAILLKEEGLYDKTSIYATDINDSAIARAEEGIVSQKCMEVYSRNYLAAGGKGALSDYYHARYNFVKLDETLKKNIVFAHHNVVADGVFCETHLLLCRNLLIYFSKDLQDQVLRLFYDSLVRGGFLCLGSRESIRFSSIADEFTPVDETLRIFRCCPRLEKR